MQWAMQKLCMQHAQSHARGVSLGVRLIGGDGLIGTCIALWLARQ